jgi:hypothetical protein
MFRACPVVAALLVLNLFCQQPVWAQANFDRPGGDYQRTLVPSGDPIVCALMCERDRKCRAWSFHYPTSGADKAICWLKSTVPNRVENSSSVSGVRGAGVVERRDGKAEMFTDRPGGDYRSFDTSSDDGGAACKAACEQDDKCRAWSYARPGYAAANATCFLKNQVKPPRRKPGVMSGVVR